jgi:hypothetical protein
VIADVRTGRGFGGLQGYLLEGDLPEPGLQDYLLGGPDGQYMSERVAWTSVRNLPVEDPHCAAMVMQATAEQNPRVEKPVYHVSLSLPPGEELTREQWNEAVDRVLKGVGLGEHQVLVVAHNDRPHQHVHLMINRVHPRELKAWDNGHDYARFEKEARHLERDLGLREVPGRHYQLQGQERPQREGAETDGERQERRRTGESSWGREVRFKVHGDFREAENWPDLERRLAKHGLRLKPRGGGLVVTDGHQHVKASRIHRRGSAAWLEKRFGSSFQDYRMQRTELSAAIYRLRRVGIERKELEQRIHSKLRPELTKAEAVVAQQKRIHTAMQKARQEFRGVLVSLYGQEGARAARRELVHLGHRVGWRKAFETLDKEPGRFGHVVRLPGEHWPPARMRRQRTLARQVARAGRRWMTLRAARLAGGADGRRAATAAMGLRRALTRTNRKLAALPSEQQLAGDVARRTLALGYSAVRLVLAPSPLGVVRAALKTAQLAQSVVKGLSR